MNGIHEAIRVLLVDDDEAFRNTAARLLGLKGFLVDCVPGGREALDFLEGNACDVVILDMRMPGLSGVDTLERIKREGHDVEVLFLTGHASVDDAVEGMRMGARDYLLKPLRGSELFDKILAAFDRRKERLGRD